MKTTIKYTHLAAMSALVMLSTVLFAQAPMHPGQGMQDRDPLRDVMYPPDMVMRYQDEIQLKKEQKELIISTMEESQKKFTRLNWDLQAEMSALQKLLAESNVNESQVMTQLDKVLDQERQIKKTQMTLMIRTKNALTEEQRAKLNGLKTR